jgi:hypothetical protein
MLFPTLFGHEFVKFPHLATAFAPVGQIGIAQLALEDFGIAHGDLSAGA